MSTDQKPSTPAQAVALHYSGKGAPRVVAKGNGLVADNIIATARAHGVPLEEDAALVNALVRVELGREIPHELYVAVAQVLAFAWQIKQKVVEPNKPANAKAAARYSK